MRSQEKAAHFFEIPIFLYDAFFIYTECFCFAVSIGAVCAGSVLSWTSPVLHQLLPQNTTQTTTNFHLTESESGLIGSLLTLGALCSSIPVGYIAERFGRKKTTLSISLPFLLSWFLIIFARNSTMLYAGRFLAGVGTGAICVCAPIYIGEIAHDSIRGALAAFFQMFLCAGILLTCIISSFTDWIMLSKSLTIVPLLFLITFNFMPETPAYDIKSGNLKRARKTLEYFRGDAYDCQTELNEIERTITESKRKSTGLRDLFQSKANRKALISALGTMAFQQLCGINAVVFYTVPIFKSSGSSLSPNLAAIIITAVQVVVAYLDVYLMQKANRRFFLMLSSISMLTCLGALAMYFQLQPLESGAAPFNNYLRIVPLISLVLFMIGFSIGYGPVPWMMMAELFPSEIKGPASGLAVLVNWGSAFLVTFTFPVLNANYGEHVTFYLFAFLNFLATFFTYFCVPETRGKSLQEIQMLLNR